MLMRRIHHKPPLPCRTPNTGRSGPDRTATIKLQELLKPPSDRNGPCDRDAAFDLICCMDQNDGTACASTCAHSQIDHVHSPEAFARAAGSNASAQIRSGVAATAPGAGVRSNGSADLCCPAIAIVAAHNRWGGCEVSETPLYQA